MIESAAESEIGPNLWCVFLIAGHALAKHGLVDELREDEDVVFELTTRGAEVARRGSRALLVDWNRLRVGEAPVTVTVTVAPEPRDDDDE